VNRSVDEVTLPAASSAEAVSKRSLSTRWVLAALVIYPSLNFGLVFRIDSLLAGSILVTAAYVLGIFVYRGIALMAFECRATLMLGAAIAGGIIGSVACPSEQLLPMAITWSTMVLAGLLVGRRAGAETNSLRLYLWGLAVVVAGSLIVLAPRWPELMRAATEISRSMAADLESSLVAAGYHAESARNSVQQAQRLMEGVIRLLPAATVMNLVVQFSVGFLWFLGWREAGAATGATLKSFAHWKVPFAVTPLLIIAIVARLLGSRALTLVADNVLLILSIYYCVGGLALVAYFLRNLKLTIGMRLLFYIALTVTGLIGYLVVAVLGFVDSFADWRKVSEPAARDLKKSH
jgi:uncharacterized protein YybS (DUF2232 family)